jgi:signal transduction histidine kinase
MELQSDLPAELPRVNGDPDRVRQILGNLLDNAFAYTPENGRITVTLNQVGDEVQVDVRDNGIGIPSEDQQRVFERFYRGEKSRSRATGGAGLGLAIAKGIVELHGGSIGIQSQPGAGTEIWLRLPQ